MVTIKIKENSKQAKIVVEMLKTFSFVEVVPMESPKVLQDLDLAFKQLKTAKQNNLKRKTLDELLNEQ